MKYVTINIMHFISIFCCRSQNILYGTATVIFILLPSIATLIMDDIRKYLTEGLKIREFEFYWHLPLVSTFKHIELYKSLVKLEKEKVDLKELAPDILEILRLPHLTEEYLDYYFWFYLGILIKSLMYSWIYFFAI